MIKRFFDILISSLGLLLASPILLIVCILIWINDLKLPFYVAPRCGKNGLMFKMIKLRSMIPNADQSGVDSTSNTDMRITPIGHIIRSYKIDEITQLLNVLIGDMSLVGPRPNVKTETDLYTNVESNLLSVKPGITDFASIVFSDEGKILENKKDPDLAYNQLIRPWKSRLGLIYVKKQSIILDLQLILFTLIALISKKKALLWVCKKLRLLGADENTILVSSRKQDLYPYPPPGSKEIVHSRIN